MAAPLIKLMRPGDWVKNVFVLIAPVFSLAAVRGAQEPVLPVIADALLAVVAFCCLASGFYALNDVVDVEKDRRHPVKRRRPVASGAVTAPRAVALGLGLIALAFALAAAVNLPLMATLLAYALLQVSYNLGIKRVMLVDVIAIATGFALRATAGAVAIDVRISVWLLLCVFFLCLYLGFIKRLCDLASADAASGSDWTSPAGYDDRDEISWLLAVSAVVAIVTYLMYALSEHARSLFGSRAIGFALLSPLVMITIHRFYRRASRGMSDSPLTALREDRVVLSTILLFGAGVLATLYVPQVESILARIFFLEAG